jgi:hypothetical protein
MRGTVPTIVPATRQNASQEPTSAKSQIPQSAEGAGLAWKLEDGGEAHFRLEPPYAAVWKSPIWRIQPVSGFHLGQIWATISKSLILND